jgi:hypothetical protein
MTVKEILTEWLEMRAFDGLYGDECGCFLNDLCPCDEGYLLHCRPGVKLPCTCGGECDFHIGPRL